jgi:hypothetical protein
VLGGRLDERGDHARARVGLRVPLDAERERAGGVLDRLGQLVERRPARDPPALADLGHALVVVGLRRVRDLARGALGERPGGEADVVVGAVEGADHPPVVLVAEVVGEVLDERPAARHVEDLHAAADTEQGQPAGERLAGERDLEVIALRDGAHGRGVGLGAVAGRVDVGAAREQEPVEQVEQPAGVRGQRGIGRQDDRRAARRGDREHIGALQQDRLVVPDAPSRPLERPAQPDDGRRFAAAHRRSNPRKRSHSVTVASKARSSTSA